MSGSPRLVSVMHGVNLDQLGRRDPQQYGTLTLAELEELIGRQAAQLGLRASFFHSNHEGDFVEHLHALPAEVEGLVLNPGAWTHYSWAIRDALEIAARPAVEVHLSDIERREPWRSTSVIRDLCVGSVAGRGPDGYAEALAMLRGALARGEE